MSVKAKIRKLWRILTGQRLRDNRERRREEDKAIREALLVPKEKRIREMEERIQREPDPKLKENLRSAVVKERVQLSEAQQVLRGLGL